MLDDPQDAEYHIARSTGWLAASTRTKCLILTTFDDEAFILDAIKFGAKGYLLKNNDPERIRDAISRSATVTTCSRTPLSISLIRLDRRYGRREKRLYISEGTVANCITAVLNKTGLEHRTQIAIFYLTGKTGASD